MSVTFLKTSIKEVKKKKKEIVVLKKKLLDTELALAEEYEKRLKMEETMNQIQLAMTEIYESQG